MGLIDSHAHLTFPALAERLDAVLARCADAGVDHVITIGTQLSDARAAVALSARFPSRISAAVGIHPHEADDAADAAVAGVLDLLDRRCVVALGEVGLDYHYDLSDRAAQRRVLAAQLAGGADHDVPLIIHCRDAFDDAVAMLGDHGFAGRPVVFHCFTGSADDAARLAEHGWRISFTGIVTFRRSVGLQAIAKSYPADRIMIETDAPYLSPEPVRGQRPNEPSLLVHTARFLADLRGVGYAAFVEETSMNTRAFFRLGIEDPAVGGDGVFAPHDA